MDVARVDATAAAPALYRKLVDLHVAAEQQALAAGLDRELLDLVRIRASQLNGCAYCVDLHSVHLRAGGEAAAPGEDRRRLAALPVWRGSEIFTARERAALELTEAVTLLAGTSVPDGVYRQAAAEFDDDELAQLVWTVSVVNTFNRLAVTGRLRPPPP